MSGQPAYLQGRGRGRGRGHAWSQQGTGDPGHTTKSAGQTPGYSSRQNSGENNINGGSDSDHEAAAQNSLTEKGVYLDFATISV